MTAGRRKARLEREHDSLGLASLAWTLAQSRRPSAQEAAVSGHAFCGLAMSVCPLPRD
jgi:hypothetical protein